MAGAAGSYSSNIQCIQYVESQGLLRWAMDTLTEPAYLQSWTELSVRDLFGCQMEIAEATLTAFLEQNAPNPFSPTTRIRFGVREPGPVDLSVYDVSGRLVVKLLDEHRGAGDHDALWDGRNRDGEPVSAGVYFCRLTHAGTSESRAMVLLR
jgi:flagellar hook assembly protein FlgD